MTTNDIMIEGFPNAFHLFDDALDAPKDCHKHCACYEREGTCCDCGENRGPVFLEAEPKDIIYEGI